MVSTGRLSGDVPAEGEVFHELLAHPHARVVHIISSDQPDPSEYDQDDDELVVVLKGSATMDVAGERLELVIGDFVLLPARTAHRVIRTEAGTEWLAVHLPPAVPPQR